jgi:hypothetical protein
MSAFGVTEIAQNQATPVAGDAVIAKSESADGYARLVVQIDANTRVVERTAGIQWVLQRRGDKGRAWQTKQALLRCVREWVSGGHPALEALPNWFPEEIPEFLRRSPEEVRI